MQQDQLNFQLLKGLNMDSSNESVASTSCGEPLRDEIKKHGNARVSEQTS